MRYLLFVLVAAAALAPAGAQEFKVKDEKKDDKKEVLTTVSEIAGKGIEQWIKEIGSKDPSKRENAMRTVLLFGPAKAYQAVPALIAELKRHSATSPIDMSVRVSGAAALSTALAGVKEPDPRYIKDAVAILRLFLRDPQAVVKMRALQALPRLGPEASAAIPEVILLVRDPDTWETRQAAIQTLAVLAADPKNLPPGNVLGALYKALHDSSSQVRLAALEALGRMGAPGDLSQKSGLLRELELASKDPDPNVQIVSHLAIMTAKQSITTDHLQAIAKMLKHPDVSVRGQATDALALAGNKGKPVAASLLPLLDDPSTGVVSKAMLALVRIEYSAAMPAIARLLKHPNVMLRVEAANTLGIAGPMGKAEAPALVMALDDPNAAVIASCIVALARLEYTGAVPALHKLIEDPKQSEDIKKAAKDAVDILQKMEKKK